jgi:hypothetical protein
MDQAPTDSAVPVSEGVDRFELRMCDRRLDHGGQVIAVQELGEIVE